MPQLLDYLGRPVDTSSLKKEVATSNVSGIRQPTFAAINNLTPERLGAIFRSIDEGDDTDMLTVAEQMEERDLHYAAELGKRKLAVTGLEITVNAASDDTRDVEIADAVRGLTKSPLFRPMLKDLCDAFGKGRSVVEIDWDKSGAKWRPKKYQHKDPRWFQFDRATHRELRLRDESSPVDGVELAPFKFAVHYPHLKTGIPARGGLALLAATGYMLKSYTLRDWIVFAEVFGMPVRLGKHAKDATNEQKAALLRAVTSIGTDAAAIIDTDTIIEFIETSAAQGGDKLFGGLAAFWDAQISKGILGQTSSAEGTPGKLGGDDHQMEVRADIRDDDALNLAATVNRDIVRTFVDLNWGMPKDDAYPVLVLHPKQKEDLKALADAISPMIDRGLRVSASVMRDKFGIEEPAEDEEVLKPVASAGAIPVAAAPAGADGGAPTADDVAEPVDPRTALNGLQIEKLKEILDAVSAEDMSAEVALLLIVASFPISEKDAKAMVDAAKKFKPKKAEPPAAPPPPPPPKAEDVPRLRALKEAASAKAKFVHARAEAMTELTGLVLQGAALTADQRALLGLARDNPSHRIAAAADDFDEVDRLTEEALGGWQKVMDPVTDPIMKIIESASSFEDVVAKLKKAKLDTGPLMEALATLMFKAHGRGDATDVP